MNNRENLKKKFSVLSVMNFSLCLCVFVVQSFFFFPLRADESTEPNRIVYLMQAGHTTSALHLYRKYYQQTGHHDLDVIQKIGLILLDQGFRSDDPEHQLLTLYGAGISLNEKALYILEGGLNSPNPQLQLVAMNFLAGFQDDQADAILNRALKSDSLLIRLEGAYFLAERGVSTAVGQTESLMCKVDKSILPVFPQIFAKIGNADAIKILKKLMANPDEQVRIAAILSAAENHRDDLLPNIRTLATHHTLLQQEACAKALGIMKDATAVPKLEALTYSGSPTVCLAALQALYRLGRHEARQSVEEAAKRRNLFAIQILGEMPGSEDLLLQLTQDRDVQVRVNAATALLMRKDSRCLKPLQEVLISNARDLALLTMPSPGSALEAYKVVPSAKQNLAEDSASEELSLHNREKILTMAQYLPEKDFLQIAQTLFDAQQNDLLPTLVALLESLQTPAAINLLKMNQQKAGAPLIRAYCALALYRLKEPGPYKEILKEWVARKRQEDLIRLRPVVWESADAAPFKIAPQDTSRLLIESFEALTQGQDEIGINVLIEAILYGNSKNKYALAGLLIRFS